jgi:long-chain acyl-CoA synthetase
MIYGTTETGPVSVPRQGDIRLGTSGPPLPWVDVSFSEEGEILIKSRHMYSGYYKDPEGTRKQLDESGYYRSGDFGKLDEEGHLIVIDRMSDLKVLSDGRKFSPQSIEVPLRFSPYIKDVLALGGAERDFVSVLINLDFENVGRFAQAKRMNYTTLSDLSQMPEIIRLVKQEISRLNRNLPEHSRIRKFVNLNKEFDADEGELTRTRKLRRTFVEKRYKDLVDCIYGNQDELKFDSNVTYQDGRTGVVKATVKIISMER